MKLLGEEKCSFCPWGHLPVYFPPLDDYHSRRETFIWKSREYERERSQSPKRSPKQSAGKASRNDFFEVDTKQRSCPEVLSSWRVLTIRLRTSTTSGILFKKEHFKCEWKRGSEEQVYQTYNCIQRVSGGEWKGIESKILSDRHIWELSSSQSLLSWENRPTSATDCDFTTDTSCCEQKNPEDFLEE